ncbi:MAG TPA: hypothetical protein VMZ03_05150, partial [Chitinophagaceae bacterium]|nr:hypothetical protein [Chitinophagaceae bacterium]
MSGVNTIYWEGMGQLPENHKIIPAATAGLDIFGNFSQAPPSGGAYSIRLGNNFHQNISAEGISYTFTIPANTIEFSIVYYYAVVFQDPQHNPDEQPRFRASVYNQTDNEVINCSDFDYTASASLPGFKVSPIESTVIYKDWTPVTLNLSGLGGKTIRLEFITSDCTFKGHFGYAYIDVSSSCSNVIKGGMICPDANDIKLTAPHGFQNYRWYPLNNYAAVLATGQTMTLAPVPPIGTTYSVVVEPFPGFGCPDTINVTLEGVLPPVANAGPNITICEGRSAKLGTDRVDHYGYTWSPSSLLLSTIVPDPITLPLHSPASFYLSVIDSVTGCTSDATVEVDVIKVDTALSVSGDLVFCANKLVTTTLNALSTDGIIQWYENGAAIGGANGNLFNPQPLTTSTYWASVKKGSCLDKTRSVIIKRLPVPAADFSFGSNEQCINAPFHILNKSTEPSINNYTWQLSDGRS